MAKKSLKKVARRSTVKPVKSAPKAKKAVVSSSRPMAKVLAPTSMTQQNVTSPSELGGIFLISMVVNSVIIYLANMLSPQLVVLGNAQYSPYSALVLSMFTLAVVLTVGCTVVEKCAAMTNIKLGMMHWMGIYFVLNTVTLWTIARYAEVFGLGIASWAVVVVLAFLMNFVQGLAITKIVYEYKRR